MFFMPHLVLLFLYQVLYHFWKSFEKATKTNILYHLPQISHQKTEVEQKKVAFLRKTQLHTHLSLFSRANET